MIGIILVNYNGANLTIDCINSLNLIKRDDLIIIVVDNCSKEEDFLKIEKFINENESKHKNVLLKLESNTGFAGGNNFGIRYLKDNYEISKIVLLNNDTVVDSNLIDELEKAISSDALMSCPRIVFADHKNIAWSEGGFIDTKRGTGINGNYKKYISSQKDISYCSFASFCCVMFDISLIDKIGLLDESYFMYFEDTDYCQRVLMNNIKIAYNPNTTVYHRVSASSGGERSKFYLEWQTKNHYKFIKKYYDKKMVLFRFYLKTKMKIIYYVMKFDLERVKAIKKGLRIGKKENV